MIVGVKGWDTPNTKWVKMLVDSLGHVQVDVLTTPLIVGFATSANQLITNDWLSRINAKLAGGLPATIDVGALRVREQGTPEQRCWGYDGVNWQRMLVESAANANLKVKLFDGANGINSSSHGFGVWVGRGLSTASVLYMVSAAEAAVAVRYTPLDSDNLSAAYNGVITASGLFGFDGEKWDRLRSYGVGILAVAKGAIQPTRTRMTGTGQVGAVGAKTLFWIACSPDSPAAEWELTDNTDGAGDPEYDHFDSDKHSEQIDFNPPMEFANGIYVKKFDHMHSLVFCYK